MALEYTEVDGIARPNSTILFLLVGSANHDPACSDKPDELVIERTENANRSIMFGDGIH
jgi:cytochrome P450